MRWSEREIDLERKKKIKKKRKEIKKRTATRRASSCAGGGTPKGSGACSSSLRRSENPWTRGEAGGRPREEEEKEKDRGERKERRSRSKRSRSRKKKTATIGKATPGSLRWLLLLLPSLAQNNKRPKKTKGGCRPETRSEGRKRAGGA